MRKTILLFLVLLLIVGITGITIAQKAEKPKVKVTEVPIGNARTDAEFESDILYLLEMRRSSISDIPETILFKADNCMKCHENKPDVEGQIFYGYPDFAKDVVWEGYIAHPEKIHAPSLQYDFYDTHFALKKKVPLKKGVDMEQILKQAQ